MQRICRVNDPVGHQRIQRIQRPPLHHVLIGLHIAVGQPLLAPRSRALKIMIRPAPPRGIHIQQPERRWPGSGGLVDENVGIPDAQIRHQLQHRITIPCQPAFAGLGPGRQTVEFELVDPVLLNHLPADVAEKLIVLRTRQRESARVGFIALPAAILQPPPPRLIISAEGRNPYANAAVIIRRGLLQRRKSMRKTGMKLP